MSILERGTTLHRVRTSDPTLSSLSFRISTNEEAQLAGEALSQNNVIHTVNFHYSILSADRIKLLLSFLPSNIQNVSLSNCQIDVHGIKALARISEESNVQHLDLSHNDIGDEGARILGQAMKREKCVWKSLFLGYCGIGEIGAKFLAQGLRLPRFVELDLRGNRIGDDGCSAIARAMTLEVDLARLDLRENRIGDVGAEALALALMYHHSCYNMMELNLSYNKIGDDGACKLANALTYHKSIRRLNLSGNAICDDGAEMMLAAMEYNDTVVLINLSNNHVSRDIREELALMLEANRKRKRRKTKQTTSPLHARSSGFFSFLARAVSCG